MMRSYLVDPGSPGMDNMKIVETEVPKPRAGELLIRIRACSINYRDQLIIKGVYSNELPSPFIPLSDGVGMVEAVGSDIVDFAVGDRVSSTFFRNWIDGTQNASIGPALGAPGANGMLSEYVALPASNVVHLARTLSFEEAATLPCAGVTAWNSLMEGPRPVAPGDHVLIMGTGGVSVLALQIARAAGAKVIATSSSDEKLQRMRQLGAAYTINYVNTPNWGAEAARLAGKGGISHIVEVGGAGTLAQSLEAIGYAGEISMVGILAQGDGSFALPRLGKGTSLRFVSVGSRHMAERLNAAVDANELKPVIDKAFPFEEARDALRYQSSTTMLGKVVITL